jgi:drug/metabolite transporter (DMT)-like permease
MDRLNRYWTRLNNKPLRFTSALLSVVGLVLVLNNPLGSTWSRVGMVLNLVALLVLAFWVQNKRS